MTRTLQLTAATLRPRRAVPGRGILDTSVTRMRVHPADLDLYRHVNNGVYLQMMDVARSNLLADLGAFNRLKERGWYPVVASSTMTYRRSLRLWDRFELRTRVLGWDPRIVYLEQSFWKSDQMYARGLVAARFLARNGDRVSGDDLAALLEPGTTSPELPEDVRGWADALGISYRP